MKLPVYLDYAATSAVAPEVLDAMLPYFTEAYGNPSTLYGVGMAARHGVDTARETIADALNCAPEDIIFTAGGTESDNAAIYSAVRTGAKHKRHLLTTPIEHSAVLEPMKTLERQGYHVEYLPVDSEGQVPFVEIARRLRSDTLLVSVMHANNEIGTIQPIAEIGELCRVHGVLFHTDAVQTFGKLPLDVRAMKIDFLSISGHKLHGPKGIGALYARRGLSFMRFMEGGEQERGRRGGTLNVPGIVGLGKATELALSEMDGESRRLTALRDDLLARLDRAIPGLRVNGSLEHRLPNNLNFCVPGVEGESLLLALDAAGICASAGSACHSGSTEPSHVLKAIQTPYNLARGALRMTLGRDTTQETVIYAAETLTQIVRELQGLRSAEKDLVDAVAC